MSRNGKSGYRMDTEGKLVFSWAWGQEWRVRGDWNGVDAS